jgi:hypothetical protein
MFAKPTVLIVGAGASKECRLPDGGELKNKIVDALRFQSEGGRLVHGSKEIYHALRRKCPDGSELNKYLRAGINLAATIPVQPSIDEALHFLSAQAETVELGKAAIAHEILTAEHLSHLVTGPERDQPFIDNANGTWLLPFLSMALGFSTQQQVEDAFHNVTMINFNYDRTIEYYLYWALQTRALVSAETARIAVSNLNIIRPYGSVGYLEWQTQEGVPYGAKNADIFEVAKNVSTYTE